MRVLALIECPNHVCYRYRIEAFASALAERRLLLEPLALRSGTLLRTGQLYAAADADVVILQRKLLPRWQLGILRRAARRLVYDLDDAMFQRDSFHPKGPKSGRREARFRATIQAADLVIVGNDYLRQNVVPLTEPERVHVIPTCVEPKLYQLAQHVDTGPKIKLVWIGSTSTMPGLQLAHPHLAEANARLPGVETRVISDRNIELAGLRIAARPWSTTTEADELAACDIGISWLTDDSWSPGKCGLKVLQYMAAGLPVVANPVGMNREMVIHGQTGLLASTPRQWGEAIALLADDPDLRRAMGTAGRRLARERFSVARWESRFAATIAAVTGPRELLPHFPASPVQTTAADNKEPVADAA
jgi:glycosyltransferase involved in cell wall biosynthesis